MPFPRAKTGSSLFLTEQSSDFKTAVYVGCALALGGGKFFPSFVSFYFVLFLLILSILSNMKCNKHILCIFMPSLHLRMRITILKIKDPPFPPLLMIILLYYSIPLFKQRDFSKNIFPRPNNTKLFDTFSDSFLNV